MTDVQSIVLEHARSILRREDLTFEDDFFNVGGDSLAGMHLVGRVGRELELPVRVTLLFAHPILGEFARAVEGLREEATNASEGSRPG